jgi:hypothetical protein
MINKSKASINIGASCKKRIHAIDKRGYDLGARATADPKLCHQGKRWFSFFD